MPGSALMSYINGCFKPLFILSLISGTIFLLLSVVVLVSLTKILGNIYTLEYVPYSIRLENRRLLAVRLLYVAFFAVIAANIGFKIQHTSKIYVQNGFPTTAALLRSPNNVKQVIAAKDDGIYSLQVKLVDRKSSMPVNNVNINVNGKSSIQDRYYNESKATSDEGTAKFILDKGDFRLSFKGSDFPDEYQIPSPFYFNLETAGTTIITVSLDAASERNPGIAEIELLDSRNAPVSGIQLAVTETQPTHENTVNTFSYTNSEGIAVFKMKEGKYQVSFLQADFPQNFLLPSPIEVDITADSVKRYTLKLVEIKQ
jgi:archaellin